VRRLAPIFFSFLAGCVQPTPPSAIVAETLPSPGVGYKEVRLDEEHRLWVYTPKGAHVKRPCVLIAPAGGHMDDGMRLGEGDQPEHLPYVEAGYIVVAYNVSGAPRGESREEAVEAARKFAASNAGVADGKRALEYALKNLQVDPQRIVSAGHSSAATIALAFAENEPRVKACLAYAPVIDVEDRLGNHLSALEREIPGIREKLVRFSPLGGKAMLRCPTLIFRAKDDDNVPRELLAAFAGSLTNVKFIEVPSGGHYDSMIKVGIPAGLAFLNEHKLSP
jgi:dipeptidyl aminopeptidase/acylaminoacyl peptidase